LDREKDEKMEREKEATSSLQKHPSPRRGGKFAISGVRRNRCREKATTFEKNAAAGARENPDDKQSKNPRSWGSAKVRMMPRGKKKRDITTQISGEYFPDVAQRREKNVWVCGCKRGKPRKRSAVYRAQVIG